MQYSYYNSETYQKFVRNCISILKKDEICLYFFCPKTDRSRRIAQFIQERQKKYPSVEISFLPEETDDLDYLKFQLVSKLGKPTGKKDVLIFLTNADLAIREKNYHIIDHIAFLQEQSPHLHFILFFETDITQPQIASYFTNTRIFANVNYYSLYNFKESSDFVEYLLHKWKLSISRNNIIKIVSECGGHFWLLKYIVRALRDNPSAKLDSLFGSEQIKFRLESILFSFSNSEQSVLRKLAKSEIIDTAEKHSYEYLKKIHIIDNDIITIPLLEKFIRENSPKIDIRFTDNYILLNQVNINSQFSLQEKRVLRLLLKNSNQIVSRDSISHAIWPLSTEESYSDWALDRLIYRLREKLTKLGLNKNIIQTLRGKGYIFSN